MRELERIVLHLLSLHYTAPERAAEPFIPGHVAYLERHHQNGTFLISGQTVPTSIGGVIIAHGVDRSAIEQITAQDPFVVNGVAEYGFRSQGGQTGTRLRRCPHAEPNAQLPPLARQPTPIHIVVSAVVRLPAFELNIHQGT
ncbi:YciI family protein [Streptomyces asoensis]|uniref:YciI family protein n=1 Tax=Streptomyces asoensis TaxID=249586 RepID=UPI0033C10C86